MAIYFLFIAVVALFFYGLIPGFGALYVRSRWRSFRKRIVAASMNPTIRYGDFAHVTGDRELGTYRFIGSLEALQGTDIAWIHDGALSVSVELSGVVVHVLPSVSHESAGELNERNNELLPDEVPQRLPWHRISTLPEGTRLMIYGVLHAERGHAVFRAEKGRPLTVVLFDGDDTTLLRRSIWAGRQQNEYWNQLTLISLLFGATILFVLAYYFGRVPVLRAPAAFALVAGLFPVLPFFPPGIVLLFLYRNLWRMGRVRRAERDLISLPVRYFTEFGEMSCDRQTTLPDGELYVLHIADTLDEARIAAPQSKIRTTSLPSAQHHRYLVCGVRNTGENAPAIVRPNDPLAEYLVIPENPWELSRKCSKNARMFEFGAAAGIVAALLLNGALILAVIANWI